MASTIDEIKAAVEQQKIAEQRTRQEQPLVRLWDGEWNIQHVLGAEYSCKLSWVSNDSGPGQIELPYTHPAAQWVYDHESRITRGEGRTVGLTVDYCGARWSGILDKSAVEQREDGDLVLVMDFIHDYEHL